MKRGAFFSLLRQDLSIVFRNGYLHVVLGLAVLFILLVNFAIPGEVKISAREYLVDLTAEQLITPLVHEEGLAEYLLPSEEELEQFLARDSQAVGIIFQGDRENPRAVIYRQGSEPEKIMRGLEASVISFWNTAGHLGQPVTYRQELLRTASEKTPFNLSLIPMLLALEVGMLGFFFVTALVFQEKEEGSIRAYRITPVGTWPYILSKISVNVLLTLLYGIFLFIFTLGFNPALPAVLLLLTLAAFLMTSAGLAIGVFFKSLSEFVYILAGIMVLLSLPVVSYFLPSFRAFYFPFIPTYPLMFGMRELIFSTGKAGFYLPMLVILFLEVALMLIICRIVVERKLMKEAP